MSTRVIVGYMLVACYSLSGKLIRTYKSALEASRLLHLHKRTIDRCIRGDTKTAKSYLWRRYENIDDVLPHIEPYKKESISKRVNRPIALIDEEGNIIKAYPSISKASKDNNVDPHSIRDVLTNKYQYAKGKRYRYLTENEASIYAYKKRQYIVKEKKAVLQLSLSNQYIKTFKSVYKAGKYLNKSPAPIYNCLSGKTKTAYGYKWKYKKSS